MGITPQPQTQRTFSAGMHVEEENVLFYKDIDFSVKRLDQLKAGKPERKKKNYKQRMRKLNFLTFFTLNLKLALQCQNRKRVIQLHMSVFL